MELPNDEEVEQYTNYTVDKIVHVIDNFGFRTPGSEAEHAAQAYVQEELKDYVDQVEVEKFTIAPKAFMGFQSVVGVMGIIALIMYWLSPIASLIIAIAALTIFILQFVIYARILDPFFPKKTSCNVIGTKKASGELKRRLIINGHIDVSYEFRWSYFNPHMFRLLIIFGLLSTLATMLLNLIIIIMGVSWQQDQLALVFGVIEMCFIPIFIMIALWYNYSVVNPGANDNLTGTYATMAVAKYFSEQGINLENTEIKFIITGSEEAGLRGAMDYAKRHAEELNKVETACIVLDTLKDLDDYTAYKTDLNSTVKLDADVVSFLVRSAKDAGWDKIKSIDWPFGAGSSDAAGFQKNGIRSGVLAAMDMTPPHWYHTRLDDSDHLNPECIKWGLKTLFHAVKNFDEKGLS